MKKVAVVVVIVASLLLPWSDFVMTSVRKMDEGSSGISVYLRWLCLAMYCTYFVSVGFRKLSGGEIGKMMWLFMTYAGASALLTVGFGSLPRLTSSFFPYLTFLFCYSLGYGNPRAVGVLGRLSGFWVLIYLVVIILFIPVRSQYRALGLLQVGDNNGYSILCFLPMLFFIRKEIWRYILLLVLLFGVLLSGKRGAMLLMLLWFLLFFRPFFYGSFSTRINRRKGLLLGTTVLLMGVSVKWDVVELVVRRLTERIAEDHGSGRDIIYYAYWNAINHAEPLNFWFGHGYSNLILPSLGLLAHNDWLQIGYNYGVFGIAIFVWFLFTIFATTMRAESGSKSRYALESVLLMQLFRSVCSGTYLMGANLSYLYAIAGCVAGLVDSANVRDERYGRILSVYPVPVLSVVIPRRFLRAVYWVKTKAGYLFSRSLVLIGTAVHNLRNRLGFRRSKVHEHNGFS